MFREAGGVDARNGEEEGDVDLLQVAADIDSSDDDDGRQREPVSDADQTRKLSKFGFFQKALSKEWARLSPGARAEYEEKARQWREQGPTVEQRRM